MKAALAGLAMLVGVASPTAARVRSSSQAMPTIAAQGPVHGRLLYLAEAQFRITAADRRVAQRAYRGAVGWAVSPRVSAYQGYLHGEAPRPDRDSRKEDQSFQQVNWRIASGRAGDVSSRTRVEERWSSTGRDVGVRLREQLRYDRPFHRRPHSVGAFALIETFLSMNDTDWRARAGLDQVRVATGLRFPVGAKSTLDAGYLAQVLNDPHGDARLLHTALVTATWRR